MGFEFKHLVFLTAMGCAGWAIALSSMIAYDDYTAAVVYKSELPGETVVAGGEATPFHILDKFRTVAQTLNVVLPLGVLCIAFLMYTYSLNPIGVGSMVILIVMFLVGTVSVLEAGAAVEKIANVDLSRIVWWMTG